MARLHLILGGARSGKSSLAETRAIEIAENSNKSLVYFATAEAGDKEMSERIQLHQASRGEKWQTIESVLDLPAKLRELKNESVVIVVDCLTLWLSNYLCQHDVTVWQLAKKELLNILQNWNDSVADLILVSNEVGHGIVPLGELSRQFVDESGWLHQDIAKLSEQVDFVMAGIAMNLKSAEVVR